VLEVEEEEEGDEGEAKVLMKGGGIRSEAERSETSE
jgi:hypothetical protein